MHLIKDYMDDFIEHDDGPRWSNKNNLNDEDMADAHKRISETQLNKKEKL